MSNKFESALQLIGKDTKGVWKWVTSQQGQKVIAVGESIVEAFVPASVGMINLINKYAIEAIKTENLAANAGEQDGSGEQKAGAVISTLTPEVLQFCAANGYSVPDAARIEKGNDLIVEFLNLFGKGTAPSDPATPATSNTLPAATATK